MTVIGIANNKGGSGKSTACANIGYSLSQLGYRVLLIDGDMQANLSLSFFPEDEVLDFAKGEKNIYNAVRTHGDLREFIVHTAYNNLDIVPSSSLMSGIEYELFTKWQREYILKSCLEPVRKEGLYDYVLIDSPPTLGSWVMNIMTASDRILIPVEASPWGLFGLANMLEFLEQARGLNPDLKLLGILISKVDVRKNYVKQTMETLSSFDNVKLFQNYIRIDSSIEWAQDNSKPVGAHKKSSRSAQEYLAVAKEMIGYVGR